MGTKSLRSRKKYDQEYYQRNKEKISAAQKITRTELRSINPFIQNLRTTKSNCKKFEIPYNIDVTDLVVPEKCPYLGIPLFWIDGVQTDNTPSIDRIIPDKGYTKGNVQVISYLANSMKRNATIPQLVTFAENILKIHTEEIQ